MNRILVTGCAGYIGSVLTRLLLNDGYQVVGLDSLKFGGAALVDIYNHPSFTFVRGDIRDIEGFRSILKTYQIEGVVNLAAIVGDPACRKFEQEATEVNLETPKTLFDICNDAGVQRFVFASTCSNYGKMEGDGFVKEDSPLNPVSHYAKTKVAFEQFLLGKTNGVTAPIILRFSTVYGLSPRIRFDLTVNEFTRDLSLGKELDIFGPQFWRPYCHVNDLARSVMVALKADEALVRGEVYNVGDSTENYQKQMIIDEIAKVVPNTKIKYTPQIDDPRDYRVNFDKIQTKLGFSITKKVIDGVEEIHRFLQDGIIADPYDAAYRNV